MHALKEHPLPLEGLQRPEPKAKLPDSAKAEKRQQYTTSERPARPVLCSGGNLTALPVGCTAKGAVSSRGFQPVSCQQPLETAVGAPRELKAPAGAWGGTSALGSRGREVAGRRHSGPCACRPRQDKSWLPPPGPFPAWPPTPLQSRLAPKRYAPPPVASALPPPRSPCSAQRYSRRAGFPSSGQAPACASRATAS